VRRRPADADYLRHMVGPAGFTVLDDAKSRLCGSLTSTAG